MTEKRYYAHKHLLQENKVHDKICHNFMNIDETVEHMNNQYWKYKQLKKENLDLSEELDYYKAKCASLETGLFQADKETEELKENCKNYNWYKQYKILLNENEQLKQTVSDWSGSYDELFEDVKRLEEENEQLKNQNELLSDELEQCKAVIDYRWSEYLKKKEEQEND